MTKTLMLATVLGAALAGCIDTEPTDSTESESTVRVEQVETTPAGAPYFVRGELGQVAGDIDAPNALDKVLPPLADSLGLSSSELRVTGVEHDALGMTHVRLAQTKNGLPVVSGQAIIHLDATGVVRSADSGLVDRDITATPSIDVAAAAQIAQAATAGNVTAAPTGELVYVIANRDQELYLAWQIRVAGSADHQPVIDDVFVDALTGRVVDRHPRLMTAKSRTIQNGNGGAFPVTGATAAGSETTPPTEAIALAAFQNTGLTYDCYKALFNRDSYDGAGAPLTSQVHVVFDYGDGSPADKNNAMWAPDVKMMAYGDGDGTNMSPLARSFDVTAHELTHAVTSATADLVYQDESGALNESMSDIMGAVCQAWHDQATTPATWLVGEDIWTPNTPGDALRYMGNPTKDMYSTDNYAERIPAGTATDNGGVHGNSGIPNLAFYLLSVGGKHPRAKTTVDVPGIGIEKAGAIFQRTLTTKLTPNSTMLQARTAFEQAAGELYPNTCAKSATGLAFAAVGVGTAPVDSVKPEASIVSPAAGAQVRPGFQVEVTSTDDQCVHKVELYIDGAVVQTITEGPFVFTTAGTLSQGQHELSVKSSDGSNTTTTATTRVTVAGAPIPPGGGTDPTTTGGVPQDVIGGCSTGGSTGTGGLLVIGLALALRRRSRR